MRRRTMAVSLMGAGLLITSLTGTAIPAGAGAAHNHKGEAPVVKIKGGGSQVKLSTEKVHPGAVQFKVHKDFKGEAAVVATDNLDKLVAATADIQSMDPATAAAAAKTLKKDATIYSGGAKKQVWQADLEKGSYYVLSLDNAFAGTAVFAKLKVKGEPSGAELPKAGLTFKAKKPNVFEVDKGEQNGWVGFKNTAKEVHFAGIDGVKQNTTGQDVREYFQNPQGPPPFAKGKSYFMEVISPGIKVVHKVTITSARYLVTCFVPSIVDGMPHAFMGMWKLVDIDD